jgi:hypothetical protein
VSRARYWQWHCHAWPLLTLRFGGVYGLQSHTVETAFRSLYLDLVFQRHFCQLTTVTMSIVISGPHVQIPH